MSSSSLLCVCFPLLIKEERERETVVRQKPLLKGVCLSPRRRGANKSLKAFWTRDHCLAPLCRPPSKRCCFCFLRPLINTGQQTREPPKKKKKKKKKKNGERGDDERRRRGRDDELWGVFSSAEIVRGANESEREYKQGRDESFHAEMDRWLVLRSATDRVRSVFEHGFRWTENYAKTRRTV